MSDVEEFAPGQRWMSDAEPELGLGIVEAASGRRVELAFPAVGDVRAYAGDSAPLTRVILRAGDRARTADGRTFAVKSVSESAGCLVYHGGGGDGEAMAVPEAELAHDIRITTPRDRLANGQLDKPARFDLRVATRTHRHRQRATDVRGLVGPRVALLPHQIYIAREVGTRFAPRVLLADEVGLGKTIEAGLVVHQQLATGRAARVLVLTPPSLLHQWLVELLRRFNLEFTLLDHQRCADLEDAGETNPFETAQLVLCPLDLLLDGDDRTAQACEAGWDIVVVDEAHQLAWTPSDPSPAYRAVERLSTVSPGLLLLTATPEQLGFEGHFARLRLLDPDRYPSPERLADEERGYASIAALVERLAPVLEAEDEPGAGLVAALSERLGPAAVAPLTDAADRHARADAAGSIQDDLLDRHGVGRVLFRNTRQTVGGLPERALHLHALDAPPAYRSRLGEADAEALLRPERLLGDGWTREDPRVAWLLDWLGEHRGEKCLLICEHAATAVALEEHLRRAGARSAVFHEGLSLARDRAAAYFAETDAGAQILVCSEIGSEGRNFQFAAHLVLFDLPRHPDLLEQRIGRLDRIGKRGTVEIHLPCYREGPQAALAAWYRDGLGVFDAPQPGAWRLWERFGERLEAAMTHGEAAALDAVVADTAAAAGALRAELESGRDRLLERSSCRPERAHEALDAIRAAESGAELARYLESACEELGIELSAHGEDSVVLKAGSAMLADRFPFLTADGITATHSRRRALSREDWHFLTWEHPLVEATMDAVETTTFGNTALAVIALPGVGRGRLLLETVYVMHCPAPARLEIPRYFDTGMARFLVDPDGRDLGAVIGSEHTAGLARRVDAAAAQRVVRGAREEILACLDRTDAMAGARGESLVRAAEDAARSRFGREIERLRALAEVNPGIRPEEIAHLEATRDEALANLGGARLELDAARVLVTQ